MSPALPAAASALMVLVAALFVAPSGQVRRPASTMLSGSIRPRLGPLAWLGGALRRRLGADPDPRLDRRMGWLAIGGLVTLPLSPLIPLLIGSTAAVRSVLRRRRESQKRERALIDELPDVVDLLSLAVSAGHNVPLAVAVVADHGKGQLSAELDRARRSAAAGAGLAAELDLIPSRLGEPVQPLIRVLAQALRDGAALGPNLEQVATDVRMQRRRAAEERARRASVRLLFPLVFCVLPAFALLTVIPLLVSTLRNLSF